MSSYVLALAYILAAAAPPLPSVDQIVERHVAARGGYDTIAALRTLIVRGEYREGSHVSPNAAMALMRPYFKLVGDPAKPVGGFAEGYDGSAWEYYGDPGFVVRTVGAASAASRHRARFDHPLIHYRDFGTTVTLLGEEAIGGRPAYRLLMTLQDGFEEEAFIDEETYLVIAERKSAPIHAYGRSVASETRFSDFRRVNGVVFAFVTQEVEIATGKVLSEFRTREIVANEDIPIERFSPPRWEHTPLQLWLEQLYASRTDVEAVRWTYTDFKRAHPGVDTRAAVEEIAYQMRKMGDHAAADLLAKLNE